MTPLERMSAHQAEFTRSDRKIQDYLNNNLSEISSYSITDVAENIGVSKSALLRFCKRIGYSGYSEFKYHVSSYLLSGGTNGESSVHSVEEFTNFYITGIQEIKSYVNDAQLIQTAEYILRADHIRLFGIHESGLSATYFSYRLNALGIDSEAISSAASFHSKIMCAKKQDLNIFFSVSGTNSEIVEASTLAFDTMADNIMITCNSLAPHATQFSCLITLPMVSSHSSNLFLDSHSIVIISIDLLMNYLAKDLRIAEQ